MKRHKIILLIVIALLPLLLASCLTGAPAVTRGWAGTIIQDGIIFTGTTGGMVAAVNSSSRSEQWQYTPSPSTAIYTTPIANDGLVYAGTYSGLVYALTAMEGANRWVYPRTSSIGAIVGPPVIADGTMFVSSSDGTVHALDVTFGDFKWESEQLAEKLWTSPAVVGNTLYVSTFDGHIYSLSTETGAALNWSFKGVAGFATSPVIYGDTIFVGSFDRHVYAIGIGSDEPVWRFPQEKAAGNWFWASPVVNQGIVYAGSLDGRLYAIDAATGEELWEFDAGNPIVVSPVVAGDFLIIADEAGNVDVFDLSGLIGQQGVPLRTISIGVPVNSSFCVQDGTAYIRSEDDSLHAVSIVTGEISWEIALGGK